MGQSLFGTGWGHDMDGILGFLLVVIIAFFLIRRYLPKAPPANSPPDGPMKVNIEERFTEPGAFNSNRVKCELVIDVVISQRDWAAIERAGLMDKILFKADSNIGEKYDPENSMPWKVKDLKRKTVAPFWDSGRMHTAKEQLIEALHSLRSHIDAVRDGPRKETFEI